MSADSVLDTFNKAIDRVLAEPVGPKRWRAANNLWLTLAPSNHLTYKNTIEENRITRESVDKHGLAIGIKAEKNIRSYLNIPTGAYYTIARADPDAFKKESNAVKFFKTFPEYTTRDVF